MIRGGRLRPLAVLSAEPLELQGYGTIPSVTEWVPDIVLGTDYFGIWAPKDVPEEVFATMDQVWADRIANSKALQDYAGDRGALFTPYYGEEAHERAMGMVGRTAWLLYEAGKAPNDPSQFGIEKPQRACSGSGRLPMAAGRLRAARLSTFGPKRRLTSGIFVR
jgi:hypothetical protein